jgi:hypothetical protein
MLRSLERADEVVEHREELDDHALARSGMELSLLARDTLAVVVEVRRHAAEVVEHLVALPLRVLQPSEQLLGGRRARLAVHHLRLDRLGAILRHDFFAVSSSSITS